MGANYEAYYPLNEHNELNYLFCLRRGIPPSALQRVLKTQKPTGPEAHFLNHLLKCQMLVRLKMIRGETQHHTHTVYSNSKADHNNLDFRSASLHSCWTQIEWSTSFCSLLVFLSLYFS